MFTNISVHELMNMNMNIQCSLTDPSEHRTLMFSTNLRTRNEKFDTDKYLAALGCVAVIGPTPPKPPTFVRRRTWWSRAGALGDVQDHTAPKRYALGGGVVLDVAERGLAPLGAAGGVTGARCARTRSRFAPLGAAGGVTTTPPPALRARGQCGLGRRAARGLALAPLRSVPPGASQAPPALRARGRCADWVLIYAPLVTAGVLRRPALRGGV